MNVGSWNTASVESLGRYHSKDETGKSIGRWTYEEHEKFLAGK